MSIVFVRYLPIIARQDWVAVLNTNGEIAGYVQGDGFLGEEWASFVIYFIAEEAINTPARGDNS